MSTNPLDLAQVVSNTEPAQPMKPGSIHGKHVLLHRLVQEHYADLYESVCSHPEIWTWWPDDAPSSASAFDAYLERLENISPELSVYAVFLPSGPQAKKALGLAMAAIEDRVNRVAEIGAFFGPALQRTTAGTEAIYLLLDLLFDLQYRRVQWKTNALNMQSRRTAERLGFVHEGTLRQHQINKGRNRDTAWYSVIDSEWPVCKQAFEGWLDASNFDEQGRQRRRLEDIRDGLRG